MNPLVLTPGQAGYLALTLRRDDRAWPIPASAAVSIRLLSAQNPSGVLIPAWDLSPLAAGNRWALGQLQVFFSAEQTQPLATGPVILEIAVTPAGAAAPELFLFPVEIAEPADTSALFVRGPAIVSLRQDRLILVLETYAPGGAFADDYLWQKLRAAEADAERQLRVFFSPVEIIPMGSAEDTAALDAAGTRWIEEPGYDFDPDLFQGETWGLLETRQRPIVRIDSIQFSWPAPGMGTLYTVPSAWIRADKKYGRINLVPTQNIMTLPLNAFILQAMGGGRSVPLMLQVRYCAGLQHAARDYPDLVDVVLKMAALSVLADLFLPQSGSISADGLSQSQSLDLEKYRESLAARLETLRQAFHGVRHLVI